MEATKRTETFLMFFLFFSDFRSNIFTAIYPMLRFFFYDLHFLELCLKGSVVFQY